MTSCSTFSFTDLYFNTPNTYQIQCGLQILFSSLILSLRPLKTVPFSHTRTTLVLFLPILSCSCFLQLTQISFSTFIRGYLHQIFSVIMGHLSGHLYFHSKTVSCCLFSLFPELHCDYDTFTMVISQIFFSKLYIFSLVI